MQALRLALAALTLTLVSLLPTLVSGCAPAGGDPRPADEVRVHAEASPPELASRKVAAAEGSARALPKRDARGEDIGSLPRYPGSVRVGYQEDGVGDLNVVRARYLTAQDSGTVRGFYRDVFRSRAWRVANVEYAGGGWHFLVVRGGREAEIRISPHKRGAKAEVRLSEPSWGSARGLDHGQGRASPASGGSKR